MAQSLLTYNILFLQSLTPCETIEIYLYLLNELVFHRNLVVHHPSGYVILLKITSKIYQHCPPLKKHIISKFNIAHVPPYFTVGNRYVSVLHARLRNKFRGLSSDLFGNHIRNDPLCDVCYVVEDTYDYFFQCRKYCVERQVFNDTLAVFSL